MFRMMFKTGTPIALWPRRLPDRQEKIQGLQTMLESLLASYGLSKLPELLLKQRREAHYGDDSDHFGHCFTLLWDDPNRLPPEDIKLEEIEVSE